MDDLQKNRLKYRSVYIHGEIDEKLCAEATMQLHFLESQGTNDIIFIYLSTEGGNAYDAFGLHDIIRNLRSPVHIICHGKVMSAGTIILQAADVRIAYPSTRFMVHGVAGGAEGKSDDIEAENKELKKINNMMAALYTEVTEGNLRQWKAKLKATTYFSAEEAKDLCLIDTII